MSKPILCLDFDGVCHSYTSGWHGATEITDPPVTGLYEFILAAREHFDIHIFSSRSHQPGGTMAMIEWFDQHFAAWVNQHPQFRERYDGVGISQVLTFDREKPAAFLTIDDRALTFTGEWPDTEALRNFRPWYKR